MQIINIMITNSTFLILYLDWIQYSFIFYKIEKSFNSYLLILYFTFHDVALCIVLHHGNTTSNLANRVLIVHIQILPGRSLTKHKHTYINDVIHKLNSHDVVHTKSSHDAHMLVTQSLNTMYSVS